MSVIKYATKKYAPLWLAVFLLSFFYEPFYYILKNRSHKKNSRAAKRRSATLKKMYRQH